MKPQFLFCLSILVLSSCTVFHNGNISGGSYPATADYEFKEMAYGEAHTYKVFGFGGWKTDAIVLEAKRNLSQNYPLKAGQAFVNYTVDFTRTWYPFVSTTQVLVSAEVVEASGQKMTSHLTDSAKTGTEAGDEVFLKIGGENWESPIEKAYVLEENNHSFKVLRFKDGKRPKVENVSHKKVLLLFHSYMSAKEQETYHFNIGDTIAFKTSQYLNDTRLSPGTDEKTKQGIVLAKNRENLFAIKPLDPGIPEGVYAIAIPAAQ